MGTLLRDLRYGFRTLARSPGFTTVTVLTLGLVIGANTALSSAIYGLVLRRPPYREPKQLVLLWGSKRQAGQERIPVMNGAIPILRDQVKGLESMAVFGPPLPRASLWSYKLWGTEEALAAADLSSQVLSLLGVAPFLGRAFGPSDDAAPRAVSSSGDPLTRARVAILSFPFWVRHFGGSREVIGRALDLNVFGVRTQCTIVGVMPQGFDFPYPLYPDKPDLWLNASYPAGRFSPSHTYMVIARLKRAVPLRRAQADVDTVADRIRAEYPKYFDGETIRVTPLQSELVRDIKSGLWILPGAAGFVLLIGCANVGNLLLARAISRERQMAIQAALGAGRLILMRQMLTEAMLLAITGGALGLLLAYCGLHVLLAVQPPSLYIPRLDTLPLDTHLLALTAGASVVAAAAFSLVPTFRLSRPNLDEALRSGNVSVPVGRPIRLRPGSFLLISEVSLALALVVSTVLLAKSLGKLLEANGLFRPDQLLALDLSFSNAALRASPDPDQMEINLCHQLEERVAGIAGVRAVALVDRFPLQTLGGSPDRFRADGGGAISENYEPAELHFVTPTYFDIMGARLVRGRPLTGADAARSLPVALINEAMAERYWRGADPLGRKLTPFWRRTSEDVAYTIVGVIHEPRRFGEGGKPEPAVYIGLSQWPVPYFSVLVRSDGDRLSIASALHAAALQILPGQMFVGKVRSGGDLVSESSARLRFVTLLLFASSGLGLLLAVVGIYALVSYYTAQRTHEIGLRMALGASPKQVLRLVLKEGMALVGCGVLLGLVIALGLGRGLASLLYQVAPTDFSAFCGAALVLLVVALVAIYIPARRATRADPMAAVRYE